MSLIEKVREDYLAARKARDTEKTILLSTFLGEASMAGFNDGKRESTDAEVIKAAKRFIETAESNAQHWNHRNPASQEKRQVFLKEIETLKVYVPAQMSGEEIKSTLIEKFRDCQVDPKLQGAMMKYLKENHAGLYDGTTASNIVKAIIASGAVKF